MYILKKKRGGLEGGEFIKKKKISARVLAVTG